MLYGASFDCGVEKTGDNHIMKFYLETLSEEFLPSSENILKEAMDILTDIIFNPLIEVNKFKPEYVEGKKKNLKQIIEAKIDNKKLDMLMTDVLRKCLKINHMDYINMVI